MGFFDFFSKKNNSGNALENVEVENGIVLPKAFADHWQEIKATGIDYVEIIATPSSDIKATNSSFGSIPFIPVGFDYPKDANNEPMLPLAQLNFSEIPQLADYPNKGLLQFYIRNDDCYGLDFDDQINPHSFRVIYIENPEELTQDNNVSFVQKLLESENSPVYKPHKLSFRKKTDYVGLNDYRRELHSFNVEDWYVNYDTKIKDQLENISYDIFCTNGHKIGGYAYFTQTDPREYQEHPKQSLLLFQMDSNDEIMWGDVGVGNFFISPEDLIKKDFTKVMYNWDCC